MDIRFGDRVEGPPLEEEVDAILQKALGLNTVRTYKNPREEPSIDVDGEVEGVEANLTLEFYSSEVPADDLQLRGEVQNELADGGVAAARVLVTGTGSNNLVACLSDGRQMATRQYHFGKRLDKRVEEKDATDRKLLLPIVRNLREAHRVLADLDTTRISKLPSLMLLYERMGVALQSAPEEVLSESVLHAFQVYVTGVLYGAVEKVDEAVRESTSFYQAPILANFDGESVVDRAQDQGFSIIRNRISLGPLAYDLLSIVDPLYEVVKHVNREMELHTLMRPTDFTRNASPGRWRKAIETYTELERDSFHQLVDGIGLALQYKELSDLMCLVINGLSPEASKRERKVLETGLARGVARVENTGYMLEDQNMGQVVSGLKHRLD